MDRAIAIIRQLHRHRYKLMILPLLTGALIYGLTSSQKKKYQTEAKLLLNLQESKGVSLSDEDLKQYQVHTYFQNTIELLKSKRTVEQVQLKVIESALKGSKAFFVDQEAFLKNKTAIQNRLAELQQTHAALMPGQFPDQIMLDFLDHQHLTASYLSQLVLAYRVMDSHFIRLTVSESTPERAQALARLFIEALIEENRTLSKNKIKGHRDVIEGLVKKAKEDLDMKIQRLEKFKVANNIINLGEHTKAIVTYLVQLEGQRANLLAKVSAGKTGKNEVYATVQKGNDLILDVSAQQELLQLKEQLRSMNRQMLQDAFQNQSEAAFTHLNRTIESTRTQVQQKIEEITRKTSYDPSRVQLDLVSKYLAFDLEAETSAEMITIIEAEINRVTRYSARFAPYESTIGAYEQEISTAQNAYLVLLNKLNLTQSMEFGSGENVIEVIDSPFLPLAPEPSKRIFLVLGGGLVVALVLAVGIVLLQLLDSTIKTVDQLEQVTNLPVVAALPKIEQTDDTTLLNGIEQIHHHQVSKLCYHIQREAPKHQGVVVLGSVFAEEGMEQVAELIKKTLAERKVNVDIQAMGNSEKWTEPAEEEFDIKLILTSPLISANDYQWWSMKGALSLLIFKANRLYTKADRRILTSLQKDEYGKHELVMTFMQVDNMEELVGEVPRSRSGLRVIIKNLLKGNLSWI